MIRVKPEAHNKEPPSHPILNRPLSDDRVNVDQPACSTNPPSERRNLSRGTVTEYPQTNQSHHSAERLSITCPPGLFRSGAYENRAFSYCETATANPSCLPAILLSKEIILHPTAAQFTKFASV